VQEWGGGEGEVSFDEKSVDGAALGFGGVGCGCGCGCAEEAEAEGDAAAAVMVVETSEERPGSHSPIGRLEITASRLVPPRIEQPPNHQLSL